MRVCVFLAGAIAVAEAVKLAPLEDKDDSEVLAQSLVDLDTDLDIDAELSAAAELEAAL